MWDVTDIIMGCFAPFIIGMLMRYASRKWHRPLLVTFCLLLAVIILYVVGAIIRGSFLRTPKIEAVIFVCLLSGALIADLLYRICGKRTRK